LPVLTLSRLAGWVLLLAIPAHAADLSKGLAAVEAKQWREAFSQFEPLARRGDPSAQVNLGNLYMRGLGVEQDYALACQWYEKAAHEGHPTGQAKLGLMHYYGLALNEDHAEAARWFRRAAENGEPGAAMVLAEMYQRGDGVDRNLIEAYVWYSVAADLGKEDGGILRTRLADELSPVELNTALTQLNVWRDQHDKRPPATVSRQIEPIIDTQIQPPSKKNTGGKKSLNTVNNPTGGPGKRGKPELDLDFDARR
jgi:hypothetical protein